jgi:hypothetical protein
MSDFRLKRPSIISGLAVTLIGAVALYQAIGLSFGNWARVGAGAFPIIVSVLIIGGGLAIISLGFLKNELPLSLPHGLVRALTMTAIGLLIGMVGIDLNSGVERYTFGAVTLYDGIPIVALAIGLFGLPEVLSNLASKTAPRAPDVKIKMRDFLPSQEEWRRSIPSMGRGMSVGSVLGIMPGAGSLIASFIAYSVEKTARRIRTRSDTVPSKALQALKPRTTLPFRPPSFQHSALGFPGIRQWPSCWPR